jgi:hypothetical protein
VKKRAKGDSENEHEIRLRQFKHRARNLGVSADAGVRFCAFLFRYRTYVQDRHSSISVQPNLLDKLGESTVETRKRDNPVRYTSNLIRIHENLLTLVSQYFYVSQNPQILKEKP